MSRQHDGAQITYMIFVIVTPLANPPSRSLQSDICIACSLPGNRRARRGFSGISSAISGGITILIPSGFVRVYRGVPPTWSVPSSRSYIMSSFPTLSGFPPCWSAENRHYVIAYG
ncbi:MAG: hypothetical protein ACLQO6_05550 [Desulfomonilaceae bacterium]